MARLIDSSALITLERHDLSIDAINRLVPYEAGAIASITASELLVGVHRASTAERRRRREAFVEAELARLLVLPFDLPVAWTHARISAELTAMGQSVGVNDLLITATALTHGYSVLTENLRDFERVPGLRVDRPDW
jgi:predicted nucleic acid-binding protein